MLHSGNFDPVEPFPSSVFEIGVNDVLVPLREDDILSNGKRRREFEDESDDDDDDNIHEDNLLDETDGERDAKRARFVHWSEDEDKLLLQLLHDQPYASWRDVGKHFPTRTVAAVKARGALLAKKLPRKSSDGTEHVLEESILDKDSVSFMKVSNVWTKEDNEKLLDAINKQRGGPRKWGKISEMFPGRTRKATEVHGMKLLMKVYGTTTTDVLDDVNVPSLLGKPSRKWAAEEDELILHFLQTFNVIEGWERYIDHFRDRTVPELQMRAKYLMRKSDVGLPVVEGHDDDFEGYDVSTEKQPMFIAWSKEEDDLLEQLTVSLPEGSGRWEAVVKMFPGRTRRAVISHARRLWAKKNDGSGVMSSLEDGLEVDGMDGEGIMSQSSKRPRKSSTSGRKTLRTLQFTVSSSGLPGSSTVETSDSENSDDGKDLYKVKTLWTFFEEETLLQLMQDYPDKNYDWVEIGKHFPGRTRKAVECHGIKVLRDINRYNRIISTSSNLPSRVSVSQHMEHDAEMLTSVMEHSMLSVSGDEDFANEFRSGRRPKMMWSQEEEETLLAAMEQYQGKGRWYDIAKLFPGRSKQAIECHGITLQKQIRIKSEKYKIPTASLTENHMSSVSMLHVHPDNINNNNNVNSNVSEATPEEEVAAALTVSNSTSVSITMHPSSASGILDHSVDMTGESLEHLENVLLEATSATKPITEDMMHVNPSDLSALPLQQPITTEVPSENQESSNVHSTIDMYRKVRSIPTSRSKMWSYEEDEALKLAIQQVGGHHWSKIALMIPGKTSQQCLGRWRTLNPSISHQPWTEEEDELLKSLVLRYTVDDKVRWAKVAQHLPGRRDTQCRARWCYNVNPDLNLSPWTDEELQVFLLSKHELGNRWSEIEKRLPGRSVNALLSRWHSVKRRLEGFILLKLGVLKEQIIKDVENYDFEKFFPTIEFTEEDAAEMVQVMKAGSFVGYKIAKSREAGASSVALASLPKIRPSMSSEDQRRLMRAAASTAIMDADTSESEIYDQN